MFALKKLRSFVNKTICSIVFTFKFDLFLLFYFLNIFIYCFRFKFCLFLMGRFLFWNSILCMYYNIMTAIYIGEIDNLLYFIFKFNIYIIFEFVTKSGFLYLNLLLSNSISNVQNADQKLFKI